MEDELRRILLNKHLENVFDQSAMRRPGSAPPQSELLPGSPMGQGAQDFTNLIANPPTSAAQAPAALPAGLAGGAGGDERGIGLGLDMESAVESFRSDPAYVSYYYANKNINPRLPPPLPARGGWDSSKDQLPPRSAEEMLGLLFGGQLNLKDPTAPVPIPSSTAFAAQGLSMSPPVVGSVGPRTDSFNSQRGAGWGQPGKQEPLETLLSAFGSPKTTLNPLQGQASGASVAALYGDDVQDALSGSAPHTPRSATGQGLFDQLVSAGSRTNSLDGRNGQLSSSASKDPKVVQPNAVGRVGSIIGERGNNIRTPSKLRMASAVGDASNIDMQNNAAALGAAGLAGAADPLTAQNLMMAEAMSNLNAQAAALQLNADPAAAAAAAAALGAEGLLGQQLQAGMVSNPQQMQAMYMAMYYAQQQQGLQQAMAAQAALYPGAALPGNPMFPNFPGMPGMMYPNVPGVPPMYGQGMDQMLAAAGIRPPMGAFPMPPGVPGMPSAFPQMGQAEWAAYYQKMMEAAAMGKDGADAAALQGMMAAGAFPGQPGPNRDRKGAGGNGSDAENDGMDRRRNGYGRDDRGGRGGGGRDGRDGGLGRGSGRGSDFNSPGSGNSPLRSGRDDRGGNYTHSRLRGDGLPDDSGAGPNSGRSTGDYRDSPRHHHPRDRDGGRDDRSGMRDRDRDGDRGRGDGGDRGRGDRDHGHHLHMRDRDNGRGGSPASGRRNSRRDDHGAERKPVDAMLEEFKSNKTRKFEFVDIKGHVYEFALDQHGSRFIQQKLESVAGDELTAAFEEVLPRCLTLMTDVFGNYVVQKFLEHGTPEHRLTLAKAMQGHVLALSLQMYGCRVVQKALEVLPEEHQIAIVAELDGHIMRCVRDQNGNHVIQKCIECVPTPRITHVIDNFLTCVVPLSTHPFGCRVIQRILEHCKDVRRRGVVMTEIAKNVAQLAQDQYGNYVIQHVLEHGTGSERMDVVDKIAPQIVAMSMHKFASNVVERCLTHCTAEERQVLLRELLGPKGDGTIAPPGPDGPGPDGEDPLQAMMKDQFGNYVVQKVLEVCSDDQREALLARVRAQLHALKKYTYGKHIVARVEKLLSAGTKYQAHARGKLLPDDAPGGAAAYLSTSATSGSHLGDDVASVSSHASAPGDRRGSVCGHSEEGSASVTGMTATPSPGPSTRVSTDVGHAHGHGHGGGTGSHVADDGLPLVDPVVVSPGASAASAAAAAAVAAALAKHQEQEQMAAATASAAAPAVGNASADAAEPEAAAT